MIQIERNDAMEDYFFLRTLTHAIIALVLGFILTFPSFVYIAMHIYVPGYSLRIPIILGVIGLLLIAWSSYRIAVIARDNDI